MKKKVKTLKHLSLILGKGDPMWFLSLIEAQALLADGRLKDVAYLFSTGVKPMKESWQDTLGTLGSADDGDSDFPTEDEVRELMKGVGWS